MFSQSYGCCGALYSFERSSLVMAQNAIALYITNHQSMQYYIFPKFILHESQQVWPKWHTFLNFWYNFRENSLNNFLILSRLCCTFGGWMPFVLSLTPSFAWQLGFWFTSRVISVIVANFVLAVRSKMHYVCSCETYFHCRIAPLQKPQNSPYSHQSWGKS